MFLEPLVVWTEGKPIPTTGTEGLTLFMVNRSYVTFQAAAALKYLAADFTERFLLHSFRYGFCVLLFHVFF